MNREQINKKFDITDEQLDNEAKEYEDGTWMRLLANSSLAGHQSPMKRSDR